MWRRLLIGSLVLATVAGTTSRIILAAADPSRSENTAAMVLHLFFSALPALGWAGSGCLLAVLRPRNAVGWLFLTGGVLGSCTQLLYLFAPTSEAATSEAATSDTSWQLGLAWTLSIIQLAGLPTVVLALYPDGRLPAPWWRWPFGAAIAGGAIQIAILRGFSFLNVIGFVLIGLATVTIAVATFVRWRRSVYPYRQQLAWFAGCILVSYALTLLFGLAFIYSDSDVIALVAPVLDPFMFIPIGMAVGVLHYGLLGINAALRRGLVYAAYTVLVFTLYFIVIWAFTEWLDEPLTAAVTAALAAVGLAPVRDRLQRAADRLVYGARRDPLQALAELSDKLEASDRLDPVPAAVATITAAVRADGAVIISPEGEVLARAGEEPSRYLALPLGFGGTEIGELRVAQPRGGGRYTGANLRLLRALTAQLAVVVSATQLTEELEAERIRVVTATRDERDRLRRDLHDGLGPSLTGMSLGLQALSGMTDDPAATTLVRRLREETDTAVRDIRRIIDGLRPTVLDTAGLTQAVERHAGTLDATLPVDVTADGLPVLAPDVEVAAYRIIAEALTNAARHAHAQHASVTISADESLHIAVSDDGCGITADPGPRGVGLSSMRRRAEALGGGLNIHSTDGGTTVTATLPLSS
jgi:signal transduction histidine kinase